MIELFDTVAVPVADKLTGEHGWAGGGVMAIDGFECDVPDSDANVAGFGYSGSGPTRSPFPKARVVTTSECDSHAVVAARIGGMDTEEQTLARALGPGWMLIAG